jgi:hypothetical protein
MQVKLDEKIWDRVAATLTRQMAFENSVADVIGNITQEEEVLGRHLEFLAKNLPRISAKFPVSTLTGMWYWRTLTIWRTS